LALLRLLALFSLLPLFCLTFGGLPDRFLRVLRTLTFLLQCCGLLLFARRSLLSLLLRLIFLPPALLIRNFALLRIFALLSLAHLPVSIHPHAIGDGPVS
jgi:hypothetical protein